MQKKWTEYFETRGERRSYIKTHRKEAKAQGKVFRVLKRSFYRQRCTGKIVFFADFSEE